MLVAVRHNIEVAHRLWTLDGKCHGLHGHSMWVEVGVDADVDPDGVAVEFGAWKKEVRGLLDGTYDHATLLHPDDPLAAILPGHGTRVRTIPLGNPTTEHLAATIAGELRDAAASFDATVAYVRVDETAVNAARWEAS